MTDSGQDPRTPSNSEPEDTEADPAQPAKPASATPAPDHVNVDPTMRLPTHPKGTPPLGTTAFDVEATMRLPTAHPAGTPPAAPGHRDIDQTMRLPTQHASPPAAPPTPPSAPVPSPPAWAPQPTPPPPPQAVPEHEVAATMRAIPIPKIPPAEPAAPPTPTGPTIGPGGERRIGKYLIKGELGRGGMGAVYLAEQTGLGREVAIKELIQSAVADPIALKRFMQEAQVMARTSHPNLVQVHDLEQIGDANYIVLEFVRGKSLRQWLANGALPLPQTFAIMHGILQALDYAHRRSIVHRDMKPENVLLSDEGDVKVADFGIARLTDDSGAGGTATKTGTTVGTPQYMSPEQVASSKVDGRSDLYSTGIVFYELIVGQPPFTASEADGPFTLMAKHVQAPPQPPSVRRPGLDNELEEVVLKSLSKRPEDRFQTGQEFDDAMIRVADRLCPGWLRSLLPGADLSKMVPGAARSMFAAAVAGGTPPGAQQYGAVPIQSVYNPTPPVKPAAKKASAGCLGIIAGALGMLPALYGLGLLILR